MTQFFFESFLRCQIGNDDTDRVCLRLEFGKRQEHRNLSAISGSERVFASKRLFERFFNVFEKSLAHVRYHEVAERNSTRFAFSQAKYAGEVAIAVENVRVG